jgi:3-dehydroquinate synthase
VDAKFYDLHGKRLRALLDRYKIEHPGIVLVPGGERSKCRDTEERITDTLEDFGVARFGEPLIVFGGGVLHDVAGLAAARYRRGIAYRMFATTLVAGIDAGFALKVAINRRFKNRIGAYHPAEAMFTDPAWFATLDHEQIRDGVGEVLKWGIVDPNPALFRLLERHGAQVVAEGFSPANPNAASIIGLTIAGMMAELANNPYESEPQRRSYIGHGMSTVFEPTVTHGRAVVLDILLTLLIAEQREVIGPALRERIVNVIRACDMPMWDDVIAPDPIMEALADTARHRRGQQSIPVPKGQLTTITYMQDISRDEVSRAVDALHAIAHPA